MNCDPDCNPLRTGANDENDKMTMIAAAGIFFASLGMTASAGDTWTGDVDLNWQDKVQSTKTRTQVIAELEQARKQGLPLAGEAPYAQQGRDRTASRRDRDEVHAEVKQSTQQPRTNHESFHHGS